MKLVDKKFKNEKYKLLHTNRLKLVLDFKQF